VLSPYLDNAGKPSEPYYTYTAANRDPSLPANRLNFYDYSKRDPAILATTNPITWNANLYPVIRDSTQAFTVLDGISWGWTMKNAMVGTDTATFVNPDPASAPVNGVGTSTFSWGVAQPDQSSLSFSGGAFDTSPNTPFKLGKLTFHNGEIASGTGANSVTLDVSMNFTNVPEKNFDLNIPLTLVNTPNTTDPIASADYVTITGFGFTFNVLEEITAAVDIYAMLTTGLSAVPNGTMPSGAELVSARQPFDPNPDYTLILLGLQDPTEGGFITSVPEPSTLLLVLLPACIALCYAGCRSLILEAA
jgi:hypothetical protein